MRYDSGMTFESQLTGVLIHPDGSHLDLGVLGEDEVRLANLKREYQKLKRDIPVGLGFAGFVAAVLSGHPLFGLVTVGLVTTAGANYVAADWLASSSNHLNAFRYHDSGTGTTVASVAQTALVAPAGHARVEGVQTNPAANQVRSVATVSYSSSLTITEWGLFSAATGGTMWDRKVFGGKSVTDGAKITFSYLLTVNAGG